jgi:transposase-like protein
MFTEPYINLKELFDNEEKALLYLIENNYVNKYKKCSICDSETKLYLNIKVYKCKNYKCRKSFSPLRGTIFSKMKLPLNIQLHLLNYYILKMPCSSIATTLKISRNTVTSYNRLYRSYIKDKINFNRNFKIGGRNKIVEMDETKIAKRKNNRGHKVEGAWVIGGIERSILKNKIKDENKKLFILPIETRDSINIDKIVKKYIKKGTTIYTDCWKGYNNLKNIGYKHETVNHKKYFKDPKTGVHTNTIEGTWCGLKQSIVPRCRTKKNLILYLREYQWRKKNREYNLWKQFLKD